MILALLGSVALAQTVEWVPMRDGVGLATDVYDPWWVSGGKPTVLIRTPYGRGGADATVFNAAGVVLVVQDMRGRGASEGTDTVFLGDGDGALQDGVDTMAWIGEQPWSNGEIATFGASALGIVQYVQAVADPPGLRGAVVVAATPSFYDDAVFDGGVFRKSLVEGWLEAQGSLHFLDDVAAHPWDDGFWDPVRTTSRFDRVHAQGLHIGGWYDIFARGNLNAWRGWQHEGGDGARGNQVLVMGPWTHGGFAARAQGELVYPANAADSPSPWAEMSLAVLADALGVSGLPNPADYPRVTYYVMGDVDDASAPGNEWRTADDWPIAAAPVRLHLHADRLGEECPSDAVIGGWVYDPADPSPTVCGANLLLPAGPCDQRAVEARADNLVLDTGPLATPVEVTGSVRAVLWVRLDQVDTDVVARLTDVYPDGRSMLITDGAARVAARNGMAGPDLVEPGEAVRIEVELGPTSIVVAPGHRLRLALTGSNAPRFEPSRNNGLDWPDLRDGPANVVHVEVLGGSWLEVPNPERPAGDIVTCDEPEEEPDTGDSGDSPSGDDVVGRGCGCSAAPAVSGWAVAAVALWVRRRRTRRG